ncbi:hypothetical protein NDU88_006648 [Pleurodeles waltl]|uniref:Uncharacterized protein n=1 Tax=Pleurodeles waltl TaxID=8319 RepID=A0AAV7SQ29_PLEWA|nr:hypothetical protein NDU88_006648 [Pleurodeles waltl]
MQSSEVRQGLTSTKLGLKSHWTVGVTWTELLDSRDLAHRAERRPKGLEGPGCRQLRLGTEGASRKTRSPLSSRQHPQKCQKKALRGCVKRCSPKVAQRSPTSLENNLGDRAMQVRVPWTQAGLCTKDFRRKCMEAGVAAKVAVPSNAVWRGEARTYFHQTWTEESLDCGSHLDRVAGFKGPRSSY